MLDRDLAELYGVETEVFNQAVKRNNERFPKDFMFTLNKKEWESLRSQFVTSKTGRGGTRYLPNAFTEQGVAMLSSVLNSETAIRVNTWCFASLKGWNADYYDFYDGLRCCFLRS